VQRKLEEYGEDVSLFRLTRIRRWMFWWTKDSVSCSSLSTVATCKHVDYASSPTHLQLMGGGGKPREPGRYNPDTLGPAELKDSGVEAT
jgi:hypothetical protein